MAPKWQREYILDHKFDYLRIQDYRGKDTFARRWKYFMLYAMTFRTFMFYVADVASVVFQFQFHSAGNSFEVGASRDPKYEPVVQYFKYAYLFCFLASLGLLASDARKARKIIRSRDISFTFTNVIAYRYYSFKQYDYFCFFQEINKLTILLDNLALYVYFRLKGWKRLIFAEAPRTAINAFYVVVLFIENYGQISLIDYAKNTDAFFLQVIIGASVAVWLMSAFSHLAAVVIYIPLVCGPIRGNLKEYVCHKIDKRIQQLIASKEQYTAQLAHLRNIYSDTDSSVSGGRQATLPSVIQLDDVVSERSYGRGRSASDATSQNQHPAIAQEQKLKRQEASRKTRQQELLRKQYESQQRQYQEAPLQRVAYNPRPSDASSQPGSVRPINLREPKLPTTYYYND